MTESESRSPRPRATGSLSRRMILIAAIWITVLLSAGGYALDRVLASLHDVPQSRWPVQPPFRLDDCGWVANRWCELLPLPNGQKQNMLMLDNPVIRLELLHDVLDEHGLITS